MEGSMESDLNLILSCSIDCSENSGRPACPGFSVTATDRARITLKTRTIKIADADYLHCQAAMNIQRYRCPKSMHLRNSQDFDRIYAEGQRAGDDHLLIFASVNQLKVVRMGMSVSRKHGSAVLRNLKRRRIREAFRRLQHDLPQSYDLIVVPRQRDDSTMQDFRNSLRKLIRKLAKRITTAECESNVPDPVNGSGASL